MLHLEFKVPVAPGVASQAPGKSPGNGRGLLGRAEGPSLCVLYPRLLSWHELCSLPFWGGSWFSHHGFWGGLAVVRQPYTRSALISLSDILHDFWDPSLLWFP